SGDGIFTNDNGNKYQFTSAGENIFSMTNFVYTKAGIKNLIVTNEQWGISDRINGIEIIHSDPVDLTFNISAITQVAGSSFILNVTGVTDRYGNNCNGLVIVTNLTPNINAPSGAVPAFNDIIFINGSGNNNQMLVKSTNTVLRGTIQNTSITDVISLVIYPGIGDEFRLSGYQTVCTAGIRWSTQTTVTLKVFDPFDNIKFDYTNSVFFTSSDTNAVLPYTNGSPYVFQISDNGMRTFPGTNFILNTSGNQTIAVSNNYGLYDQSGFIFVIGSGINSFNIVCSKYTQKAGVGFVVKVTNAVDGTGNPTDGTVYITNLNGLLISPSGNPPSYNNIIVNNGIGQNIQTIFKTTNVVLKGVLINNPSITNVTSPITIFPAQVNQIALNGGPTVCTAGARWNNQSSVTVAAFDLYQNIKSDYTNAVYFTSTDPTAVLPYTNQAPYVFQLSDNGLKVFDGTNFTLKRAGSRRIRVIDTNTGLFDNSDSIQVDPGFASTFNIVLNNTIQVAGQPFILGITNAKDSFGNLANSIMKITNISGGGASPGGNYPIYNNITVLNGSGSAQETLFNAVNTVLMISNINNGVTNSTGVINVVPSFAAGTIILNPVPSQINANNSDISLITSSTIRDTYANIATNNTLGTVAASLGSITNTDISVQPGKQVPVISGLMRFGLRSTNIPGIANITASVGAAAGSTNVIFKGITLVQVSSPVDFISKGQSNLPVGVIINNTSSSTLLNASVGLTLSPVSFQGIGPSNTFILPNTTRTLNFFVSVTSNALSGATNLDGYISGTLNGNNVSYTGANVTDSWTIQNPGRLIIEAFIVPAEVVVGFNFNVTVRVRNTGEATITNINPTNFIISSTNAVTFHSETNYSPKDQTLLAGLNVDFIFNYIASGNQPNMYFGVQAVGTEVNNNARILSLYTNSTTIKVTTLSEVELQLTKENISPITVSKGQANVEMLKMSLYNPLGVGAANIVEISRIRFDTEDHAGNTIIPSTVITKIKIYDNAQVYLETSNISSIVNYLDLQLDTILSIDPLTTKDFFISIDISPNASAETFALNFVNGSYLRGNLINVTNVFIQNVVDEKGNNIDNMRSDFIVIKGASFEEVLGNYPNPFNPNDEATSIEYYLKTEGTVNIDIYTLTGYHVIKLLDKQLRLPGVNTEGWDGRNDSAVMVRNGVYLAVIKADCIDGNYEGVIKVVVIK
ncbi:MAG: hypothetical protein KKH98_14575, partial [Spirochaetes bacterium]|nr:hypothetical protein [Spirochaetota bacterium]